MSARPGVGLPGSVTMREAEQLAAESENAGASGVWVSDVRREPYLLSAAALRATTRVTVGTDVAVAFSRSPAATAQAAWDLAGYGNGRFVLGLGSQVGPTLLSRFGVEADHPAGRLRDYVLAVRACWDAYRKGRGRYEGEFYAIRQPVFSPGADDPWPSIPIYVAGVNPVMTAVAGEIADGFAAHMPALQNWPFMQAAPHAPQFAGSDWRSRQVLLHAVRFCGQETQAPFWQTCALSHMTVQLPQK